MSLGSEFKEFILRGKVVDLAVGVAVGGAFTKLVESVVQQVLFPLSTLFGTRLNLQELKFIIRDGNKLAGLAEVSINYGLILNAGITFLIVGFVVFLFLKVLNNIYKADTTDQAKITNELLREMRDLMAKNG